MPMVRTALPHGWRPGRLVIVGSGIKSIGQFTLEAVSHIEQADRVFYCVADPATEAFVESRSANAVDMYDLYDDGKPRHQTYTQMAEVMLREVRKGRYVVGVFYGHPGVFVNPAHRALAIAAEEGHDAVMLPGVSAEDCLYADLGIDPSRPGCQTLEATDLLLRGRPLLTDSHVIIFQVGSVGDLGFNFAGFKNTKFQVLVGRLVRNYGADHPVVHYVAAQHPMSRPVIEHFQIKDLQLPEIAKRITGISTFYLAPKVLRQAIPEMASALGLRVDPSRPSYTGAYPPNEPYSQRDLQAIAALDKHTTPPNYKKTRATSTMFQIIYQLATDPKTLAKYRASPEKFVASTSGLRPSEASALASSHPGRIWMAMKATPQQVAAEFVQAELRTPTLAQQYSAVLKENQNQQNGEANIAAWLKAHGYDTTADDVYQAFLQMQNEQLDFYDSNYGTTLNGATGPTVLIRNGAVTVNGIVINKFTYAHSTLSWNEADGNPSSAVLNLQVLTSDAGKPLPANSYIGPQFFGIYWAKGATKPAMTNIYGRVGVAPSGTGGGPSPVAGTPLSNWDDTYETYLADATGKYQPDSKLVVATTGNTSTVTYAGAVIKNYQYTNDTLSWSTQNDNATNVSIYFYVNKTKTSTNPAIGNQFSGKRWAAGASTPTNANFFGQLGTAANPNAAASDGGTAAEWKQIGINLGVGVATMLVGTAVIEAIKAFNAWRTAPNPANQANLNQANGRANVAAENEGAVAEQGAEANPGAEAINPGDVPAQAEAAEAEAAEAAEAAAAEAAEAAEAAAAEAAEAAAAAEAAEAAAAAEVAEAAAAAEVAAAEVAAAEVVAAEVVAAEVVAVDVVAVVL
jgi:Tetrapyrrole (Corrin/Porphyrin) Methylases